MTAFIVTVLALSAIFNVVAWPTFFRRVARDSRARDAAGKTTAFFRVHLVLLVIGLALAAASIVAAVILLTAGVS